MSENGESKNGDTAAEGESLADLLLGGETATESTSEATELTFDSATQAFSFPDAELTVQGGPTSAFSFADIDKPVEVPQQNGFSENKQNGDDWSLFRGLDGTPLGAEPKEEPTWRRLAPPPIDGAGSDAPVLANATTSYSPEQIEQQFGEGSRRRSETHTKPSRSSRVRDEKPKRNLMDNGFVALLLLGLVAVVFIGGSVFVLGNLAKRDVNPDEIIRNNTSGATTPSTLEPADSEDLDESEFPESPLVADDPEDDDEEMGDEPDDDDSRSVGSTFRSTTSVDKSEKVTSSTKKSTTTDSSVPKTTTTKPKTETTQRETTTTRRRTTTTKRVTTTKRQTTTTERETSSTTEPETTTTTEDDDEETTSTTEDEETTETTRRFPFIN